MKLPSVSVRYCSLETIRTLSRQLQYLAIESFCGRVPLRVPCESLASPLATKSACAENRLDKTRTDALISQLETGNISCVHRPYFDRLSPGACSG